MLPSRFSVVRSGAKGRHQLQKGRRKTDLCSPPTGTGFVSAVIVNGRDDADIGDTTACRVRILPLDLLLWESGRG